MINNNAIICVAVFHFPNFSAAITTPSFATIALNPVINNSLNIIINTNHKLIWSYFVRTTNAEITNNLSAKGSINFPKFVTILCFLAICPSK